MKFTLINVDNILLKVCLRHLHPKYNCSRSLYQVSLRPFLKGKKYSLLDPGEIHSRFELGCSKTSM